GKAEQEGRSGNARLPTVMKTSSLALLSLLFVSLVSCGGDSSSESSAGSAAGRNPVTGENLYRSQQCMQCHGAEGRGMPGMGPTLHNLSEHWTKDSLDEYLLDPQAVSAKNERLGIKSYRMKMPPVRGIESGGRAKLIDYILTL
ncbi:MAG: cytochrome c, partial [Planctomycetota bacterium]